GGAGFLSPNKNADKQDAPSLYPQFKKAGYTLAYGLDAYNNVKQSADKIILMNDEGETQSSLKFAIDQEEGDLNLAQITDAAIESLTRNNDTGFFLMVEGGKIDWSAHANDATTTIQEVLDFNEAVKRAYRFYEQHPEETLIIVTADHETGGIAVGNGGSRLNTKILTNQRVSQGTLSKL